MYVVCSIHLESILSVARTKFHLDCIQIISIPPLTHHPISFLLSPRSVGKTSLMNQYVNKKFSNQYKVREIVCENWNWQWNGVNSLTLC